MGPKVSGNPDQPEIVAQKQDMENGFRWLIERNSLPRPRIREGCRTYYQQQGDNR